MSVYAVLDTNVLVSALLSSKVDAATVQVLERTLDGDLIPVFSDAILEEYEDVLHRSKFGFDHDAVRVLLGFIESRGLRVDPSPTGMLLPDMKDLPFYEVVMEAREDDAYLVTGNLKHFPSAPFIVTARQMLDILEARQ